jgi:hypothetical protein
MRVTGGTQEQFHHCQIEPEDPPDDDLGAANSASPCAAPVAQANPSAGPQPEPLAPPVPLWLLLQPGVVPTPAVAPVPAPSGLAAAATAAPASAAYVGERPADVTWLRDRETALIAVRHDYEAQLAQAQAALPTLTSAGPGWTAIGMRFDDNDRLVPAPQSGGTVVQVVDPQAPPQVLYADEGGTVYGPPLGPWFEFNEAAFAKCYPSRAAAQASSPLQTLARSYNTDAAGLLNAHPGIWGIATSDHAINAGPAQAGRAMGDPGQLGKLDLLLADETYRALIQQFGGTPEPARTAIALEQVRVYGQARFEQLSRLDNAMQAVRDQYVAALNQAQSNSQGSGPGWCDRALWAPVGGDEGSVAKLAPVLQTDAMGRSVPITEHVFDPDVFTTWYEAQSGLAHQAFKQFYGASHTSSPTGSYANNAGSPGAARNNRDGDVLTLNNDAAVGFDLEAGWVTPTGNLHDPNKWVDQAFMIVAIAAISYFSTGTLGPEAASALGMTSTVTTAVTTAGVTSASVTSASVTTTVLTTTGAVVSAAVAGATTSLASGILNDNLTFKGVLIGALAGALSVKALQALSAALPAVNMAAGTVGGFAANFTVQTGIQALIKGKLTDQLVLGAFASSLGSTLAANMEAGITDAKLQGAEAFAARTFASLTQAGTGHTTAYR